MTTTCLMTRQVIALESIAASLAAGCTQNFTGAQAADPLGTTGTAAPTEKPKRVRRTKAQIEADKAAEAAANGAPAESAGTTATTESAADIVTETVSTSTAAVEPASEPAATVVEPEPAPVVKPMDAKEFKTTLLSLGRAAKRDDFTDVLRVLLGNHNFKSTQEVTEDLRATILAEAPALLESHPPIVKEEEI